MGIVKEPEPLLLLPDPKGRFADGIAAFRLGLAVEQGDAELSEKLRDGLAWAKLRLAAERRKQNAEGAD